MINMSSTMKCSKDTLERLAKRGKKGDTYEDIVKELLDNAS